LLSLYFIDDTFFTKRRGFLSFRIKLFEPSNLRATVSPWFFILSRKLNQGVAETSRRNHETFPMKDVSTHGLAVFAVSCRLDLPE